MKSKLPGAQNKNSQKNGLARPLNAENLTIIKKRSNEDSSLGKKNKKEATQNDPH